MTSSSSGKLYVVGVGPGDAELITLKAARIIADVPVIAFFANRPDLCAQTIERKQAFDVRF